MFGRKPKVPIDLICGDQTGEGEGGEIVIEENLTTRVNHCVDELKEQLNSVYKNDDVIEVSEKTPKQRINKPKQPKQAKITNTRNGDTGSRDKSQDTPGSQVIWSDTDCPGKHRQEVNERPSVMDRTLVNINQNTREGSSEPET
ncbi:hypothetical protein BpHYR1_024286, partial [Brachionus plicatilis]